MWPRDIKELIMRLHTGETQYNATPDWNWEDRKKLGIKYLEDFSEDLLNTYSALDDYEKSNYKDNYTELYLSLESDGYKYKDLQLYKPEIDILDVGEITGVLHKLFLELDLGNRKTTLHHLELSEEHYLAQKWDDSISNSRKFLESVLQEIADKNNQLVLKVKLDPNIKTSPFKVRDYLENEKLLEKKEKEALSKIYGLLSHTGSHPYMAENDQARLLRHLSLTFAHFIMLRLQGKINSV